MNRPTKAIAVMMTFLASMAVTFLAAVPAKAQNLPNAADPSAATATPVQTAREGARNLDPISQWIILSGLFTTQTAGSDNNLRYVSQWIVLNWLFGNGNNFNSLDQVSKWIVLTGIFGNGQQQISVPH